MMSADGPGPPVHPPKKPSDNGRSLETTAQNRIEGITTQGYLESKPVLDWLNQIRGCL
jgi:hypothetical protein